MDKEKSFIEKIKEIDEKEKAKEEEEERLRQEKLREQEKLEREEYEKRLMQERIELMKLKSGVISEPELVAPEKKEEKIYTFSEKVSNFFYHNKLYIIIAAVAIVLGAFFIYDIATAENPDANVLVICSDAQLALKTEELQKLFEGYAEDRNGDGKVLVSVQYTPIDEEAGSDPQAYQANITKVIGEIQANDSLIMIGDTSTLEKIGLKEYCVDFSAIYPDNSAAQKLGIELSKTKLNEKLELSSPLSDDIYLCVQQIDENAKEKIKSNHENALSIADKFLKELS